jgi:hypothetical protein
MSDDTADNDRLGKVTMNLLQHGLHVQLPVEEPGDPDAIFILARHPASGECAQIRYAAPRDDPGGTLLELIYRTDRDHDPDGAHLASRAIHLLTTGPPSYREREETGPDMTL